MITEKIHVTIYIIQFYGEIKMDTYTKNMTEGSELSHILRFALPLLLGNLFQQIYNIVDSVIVGKVLGKNALAAVGATGSITFLFYTLCIGLSIGAGVLISQSFGAGREKEVRSYISNSAYVLILFGLVLSLVSAISAESLLKLLGTPKSILPDATSYMRIACAGTVCVAAYNWINSVMRSLGDSKTPLVFLIIASLLNAALDLLFVVAFDFGVSGAAWATVTAQAISAIGCILFSYIKNEYFKLSKDELKPNRRLIAKCITTGVPIALQNALISVSMVFLQRAANTFGETVMAAYTVTMRVEQLIQQPFQSLNAAVSTFTGQNTGADKPLRVTRGYRQSLKTSTIFALFMLIMFMLFSNAIVRLFVNDAEVIRIGSSALKVSACFYIFLGFIHTTRGLLNGAGDVGFALINGVAEFVGRVGFSTLLLLIPFVGIWAVWGTTCLTWVLTAVMSFLRYTGGKWKDKKLV